jgi:hypothetical protein
MGCGVGDPPNANKVFKKKKKLLTAMDTDPDPANDADPAGSVSTTLPVSARI